MSVSGFSPVKATTTLNNGSKSGIINTGTSTTKARRYDTSGNEKYIYPTTDAIQKLDSSKAIADYFTYTDRYGDTKRPITEDFGQFKIEVQKEAAEGIQWAMETYKLDTLPKKITRASTSKAYATYDPRTRTITLRPSLKEDEAYIAAVHEMTHYVDHIHGDIASEVCTQARKNLGLRANSKQYERYASFITSYYNDPAELLAYSAECHVQKSKNPLVTEIMKVFIERIEK